jgi:MFS family permease
MPEMIEEVFPIKSPGSSSLWHNRAYLLVWSGTAISLIGTQASQLAFPLLVLTLTNSAALAGLVGALRLLPYLLLSLPAGALLDRWDRKRVMIVCDTLRAVCLASIPLSLAFGMLSIVQLFLVALAEGIFYVVFDVAAVAFLPQVVSKEQLPEAKAQHSITLSLASLLGAPLGGALYGIGQFLPFLTDALSYALSVLALTSIRVSFHAQQIEQPHQLWQEIKTGIRWFWQHSLIRFLAVLAGSYNLLVTSSITLLLIVFARQFHASPFTIGVLLATMGTGGIGGALVAPSLQKRFSVGFVVRTTSWLMALLWIGMVLAPNVVVLGGFLFLFAFVFTIYDVVQFSYRALQIPHELQGRVNSIFRLIAFGGQPLGLAVTGLLLQWLHVFLTGLLIGGGLLLLAVIALFNPLLRTYHPWNT